jgi:hypothetical protein
MDSRDGSRYVGECMCTCSLVEALAFGRTLVKQVMRLVCEQIKGLLGWREHQ